MLVVSIIAAAVALIVWALVIQDLGRRLIAHADGVEERRRAALLAIDVAAVERRLTKLEQAERQTATVLGARR